MQSSLEALHGGPPASSTETIPGLGGTAREPGAAGEEGAGAGGSNCRRRPGRQGALRRRSPRARGPEVTSGSSSEVACQRLFEILLVNKQIGFK